MAVRSGSRFWLVGLLVIAAPLGVGLLSYALERLK